ncbi:MAG: calcium-translocating P-type ATPase, PMCA-type [Clostridia bacterium]|nr:calcium-translocating P-type ATPase, PMCA-type [Clostridia bacterium]
MVRQIYGLTEDEVLKSRERHGENSLKKLKQKGFFQKFLENLCDPIIKILLVALAIELIFTFRDCNYFEICGIVAAILIATTVSTASEIGSEAAFRRLEAEIADLSVKVMRAGEIKSISIKEIVVGDLVYLSSGERIHADGVVVDGEISVDQSMLNGEGVEVKKTRNDKAEYDRDISNPNLVFSGSLITSGAGIMRVSAVGQGTFLGEIANDVQTEKRNSPLKLRLNRLASQISKIGYIMAIFVGLSYLFNIFVLDNGFVWTNILVDITDFRFLFKTLVNTLTVMITVIVVSTPEGLPMMITVVLSRNMKRMLSDNVLVKKLVGIETAGSLNILFTDKTGTLTEGKLSVDGILLECGYIRNINSLKKYKHIFEILRLNAEYNTDSMSKDGEVFGGNSTDVAITSFFNSEFKSDRRVVDRESFKSENKYSSVILDGGLIIYKGAPERILREAGFALSLDGKVISKDLTDVICEYERRTKLGERLIAVAYSDENNKGQLVFVSLIVLRDKLRRDCRESVKTIKKAGINVVMITGDGIETARSIARECGIITSTSDIAITSDELRALSDEELIGILPALRVVARALPRDKLRLVTVAQRQNLVVGMTGDGVNDAPSLKMSDVGFCMGSGTEISKEASDIIILDNSISSICRAILYGRTIFKSIRKFITFQLVMNIAACGVTLFGQFVGIDNPITIIQMLWINIIMDTLGGLAFAGEPPLGYYMSEKPKRREEPILSADMMHHILSTGAFTLVLCIAFLSLNIFKSVYNFNVNTDKFYTAFYALFVFSGIFNSLLARSERLVVTSNLNKNKGFVIIMLLIAVVQILMIYFGGEIFRCVPLSWHELSVVISFAFCVVPFEMLRRLIYKLK